MIRRDFLAEKMAEWGFTPTDAQLEAFDIYASLLVQWKR